MHRLTTRPNITRLGTILAFALATSGCKGCTERKPYTPFTLDGGAPTDSSAVTPTSPSGSTSGFVPLVGLPASSGDSFPLEPGSVPAPAGRVFVSGLPVDADGDGNLDLFAWVETSDKKRGELWFVRGNDRAGHGLTLATPPVDLGDPGCKREVKLSQIGTETVLAQVDARCAEQKIHRWFAIVRLHVAGVGGGADRADSRDPELRLEGRLRPPAPGESMKLAFDATDRDNDKTDDLRLDLTLEGVGEPFEASGKVTLPIVFVDRPAGFARDPSEPEATLAKLSAGLVAKARSAKTAPDVVSGAAQLLRAATIACEELGEPLLSTSAGAVRCGDGHYVGDAIHAVGVAGISSGDIAQAIAARTALAELKPASEKRAKELDTALAKAAPIVEAIIVKRIAAAPAKTGVLSSLTFDADGNLLVVSESGVARIAASDLSEDKSDAVAWPRTIAWQASGTEFAILGAARKCDPSVVVAKAQVGGGPTDTLLPTISAMIPKGARAGSCHELELPLAPLVTEGHGAIVAIGADVIRIESSGSGVTAKRAPVPDAKSPPSLPGASRSPDGTAFAIPLSGDAAQVLVLSPKGARRWHSDDLRDATSCVPRSGGTRIACITKSGALLAEPR